MTLINRSISFFATGEGKPLLTDQGQIDRRSLPPAKKGRPQRPGGHLHRVLCGQAQERTASRSVRLSSGDHEPEIGGGRLHQAKRGRCQGPDPKELCHCGNIANRICLDAVRTMRISRIVLKCLLVLFSLFGTKAFGVNNKSLRDLDLIKVLSLKGTIYHVQGVDLDDEHIWVTSADTEQHLGHLSMFARATDELEKDVTVGGKERFHPGGISTDADSIWIPVAEYRPNSTSVIEQRSKETLALLYKFDVPDHIGCLAVSPRYLVGGNWGSRLFYVWDRKGRLLRKFTNSEANQYQDLKFFGNYLVASGVVTSASGSIDWLEWPSMRVIQRVLAGTTSRGVPFTNEGMSIDKEFLYLLPEDGPSRLFIYRYQAP
jgi:hypothetical protein